MMENQSIAKKERIDFQSGHDMLSELPLSIIHIILALIPIRDAVKTSILSRQWRYTWATLPHLVFKERGPIRDSQSRCQFEDRMENFITQVLVLHKGPIHKFELFVRFKRNCRSMGFCWLLCLSRNDIRELIIYDNDYDYFGTRITHELHSSIYSCRKLIKLELHKCKLDPPPTTFKAFLFLKCLYLQWVFLSTNEVESLVANCPLLEEFTLIQCESSKLIISAPNLKVLHLEDDYIEMSVYAPQLAELSVELLDDSFTNNHQQQNSSVCNYIGFIGGFTNLEKLHAADYFTKYLSMGIKSCHHTLVFHQLKDIELNEVNFEDMKFIALVARLIIGAPNLQKLEIANSYYNHGDVFDASAVRHLSLSDFGCAPNFKLEKLRDVKMRCYVTGILPQIAFISFLLDRSPVLATMSFSGLTDEKEQDSIGDELEGCSRASPNAKFVYLYE